ncbi:hypothetical protein LOZ51_003607 [Ophidiomyces ophidiicola]|nr:hypothetical protein LOZ55_003389 [Ophidiomyces ophidiicola]KAI1994418.1 hypothetical protein LOZ51_003607 [Ophidiomyces ophidiicola]KAI1994976.1 hypothetical protein LOZ54_000830 [Ophidiomyces ophidiicola]
MLGHLIIQDSDESDDGLTDPRIRITQISQLENAGTSLGPEQYLNPDVPGQGHLSGDVVATDGQDPCLTVNFDDYLVSTGQTAADGIQHSLVGNSPFEGKCIDVHTEAEPRTVLENELAEPFCSPLKGGLKRSRTTMNEEIIHNTGQEYQMSKRSKTMVHGENQHSFEPSCSMDILIKTTAEAGPFVLGQTPANLINEPLQKYYLLEQNKAQFSRQNAPETTTSSPSSSLNGCQTTQNKSPLRRSKSVTVPTNSPHDTEPLSSTRYARARRTLTHPADQPLPASSSSSVDELSLPISVKVVVTKVDTQDDTADSQTSDTINLASDDFGGMPKEMYRPRPSRSRAKGSGPKIVPRSSAEPYPNNGREVDSNSLDILVDNPGYSGNNERMPVNITEEPPEADKPTNVSTNIDMPVVAPAIPTSKVLRKENKSQKKRKLKRGKTMSIILKKSSESDIEDDVIWVENAPVPIAIGNSAFNLESGTNVLRTNEITAAQQTVSENDPDEIPAPVPPRKKRSRKPKNADANVQPSLNEPNKKFNGPNESKDTAEPSTLEYHSNLPENTTPQPHDPASPAAPSLDTSDIKIQDTHPQQQKDSIEDQDHQEPIPSGKQEILLASTPQKAGAKGPDKHSPIAINNRVTYRVGLSRKARIAPLLKIIRK